MSIQDTNLALMEGLSLNLPLLLKAINHILVAPANLMGETLHRNKCQVNVDMMENSCDNTLTVQYFLPGFSLSTRRASGTTIRFFLS